MDFFDRHKALIITLLFFAVLLLSLYNLSLSNNIQKERELLVDLDSFKVEEAKEEEKEPEELVPTRIKENIATHQAFNQNQESRDANFNEQLNEIFQKNSAAQLESSDENASNTVGSYNLASAKKKEPKKQSDGNTSSEKISTQKGGIDNSSISYSLRGRTAIEIPNPIYTCDRSGKVVINITVNEDGRVVSTSVNKGSSSTNNECLTDQAEQYANQAYFSSMPGRSSQPGTITYNFKP
ncbi:TonB family protein [Gillisia mitskevichiae]|uniref:TonB family protein n=1 Tax=Gillisia mitskevichiae TaxID=270921 RepID=A0A495PY14_9FLAO|nr:energy transducer TonB [Gillisia mitskevichiae]RKS55163.1 TonB family protein [Gillisia mitskevichiae]